MEMSLDQLEELAKQDGVEFLDLSKSQCFHYVEQHLNDPTDDKSHYNNFMTGCYTFLAQNAGLEIDSKTLSVIMTVPKVKDLDWRDNAYYGYHYAKYVINYRVNQRIK